MFIVTLTYKKPIELVDQYVVEHRAFLDQGYSSNFFIASGPQNPRTGGIIISQLKSREQLEAILQKDPFFINGIADYSIVEFEPVKYHPAFSHFVTG
jgi:uncharacterized protein YciI